jgi:gas vesicle protein
MNNTSKILIALGTGVLAGAILGILFTPDKGSEIRRKINEQGKKIADDVQGKFRKGKEKFNNLKEDIVQPVKEKVEEFT